MRTHVRHLLWFLLLSVGAVATAQVAAADANPGIVAEGAPPPDAPPDLKRLIGEYRSAEVKLTIYEAGGQLHAEGLGLNQATLRQLSATRFSVDATAVPTAVQFQLDRDGRAVSVTVGTSRLQFKDIGLEVVQQIRAGVKSDSGGQLRAAALAAKPPAEPPAKRPFDLVDLASVDPTIKFDIRYASSNNFLGFPLYERAAAYLQRPAARGTRPRRARARLARLRAADPRRLPAVVRDEDVLGCDARIGACFRGRSRARLEAQSRLRGGPDALRFKVGQRR